MIEDKSNQSPAVGAEEIIFPEAAAGIYVTTSILLEYLFCPRFIYFMNCLCIPQNEDKRFKV